MRKLSETQNGIKSTASMIEKEGGEMDALFQRLTRSLAAIGAGFSVQQIVQQVVTVRGEFQQLEVAFRTMLGSEEKASVLMSQLVDLAAKTPFDLQGVANGARQLLAYGENVENITDDLTRLGNIAAGLSQPLGDLVYLYGTTMTQGRLYTQDLLQFTGRGIPMIRELAKEFGVAESEIRNMVEHGKVGFPEVQQVIQNLTNEGGMFYNLMQEQSKTITGQISNLQDSFSTMLNEIGQNNEGMINNVISGLSYLVDHYQQIIDILKVLVATYGGYKAALIAVSAWQKAAVSAGSVKAFFELAKGIRSAKDAMLLFNMAVKSNPIGLIVGAVSSLIAALSMFINKQKEAKEAQEAALQPLRDEYTQTNLLVTELKNSNLEHERRKEILDELKSVNPGIVQGIDDEATAYEQLAQRLGDYNKMKQAEISLKSFSMASGFDEAVQELSDAKAELDKQSAGIVGTYTTLFTRLKEMEANGEDVPENVASLFNSIFESDLPVGEKLEALFAAYNAKISNRNAGYGFDAERNAMQNIFRGLDIDDYKDALSAYNDAEEEYAERKEEIAKRIEATANALYQSDAEARQEFVQSMNALFFPSESTGEATSTVAPAILPPDFNQQVAEAKQVLADAQQELANLRRGIAPEGADEKFSFASAIEAQEKAVKEAEGKLATLTGYDPKAAQEAARQREQAEKQAADAALRAQEEAADAELDLQRRKTKDKIDLLELEKQAELAAIDGRIAAARSKEEKDALERLKIAREADYDWQIKEEQNVQLQQERDELQALLRDYATYAQALQTVNDEYDRQLKFMRNADGTLKEGVEQGNIDELERQRQQAIDQISVEFASREAAFTQWSNSLQGKTLQQLQSMLAQSEAALAGADLGDTDPETVARLRAEVVTLRKRLEEMQDDTDSGKASWADLQQVLSDSISTFEQIGEAIGGTAGSVINSFGQIAGAAVSMANGIQAIGEAATAAEKASAILAVISAAIKAVTFITDGLRESKEATKAAALATREYEESLEALARTRAVEQHTNIFGTDTLREISTQAEQAKELMQGIRKQVDDLLNFFNFDFVNLGNILSSAGYEEGDAILKAFEQNGVIMQSDMRSGWQKLWGTGKDNIFNLRVDDVMTNGEFDGEKLREWYEDYGDGLSEENKAVIQTMIDQWDEYQTALQAVADNISSMMGDIANTVAGQLVDGFIETGDAVIDVEKAVGDLARSFAMAAVKQQLLDNVFNDELEARVTDLIVDGDTAGALQAITSALDGANLEGIAEVLQGLDQYFDRSDAEGGSSDRTASQKGIAAASQDSVDELNARATTIQGHTYSIMNGVAELNRVGNLALERLAGIEANTAETNAKLDTLLLRYRGVQSAVTNLQAKGIKVAV